MTDLEKAKNHFETLGTAIKNTRIIAPEENEFGDNRVLKVSFSGSPNAYAEQIGSIKRNLDLKQVQPQSGRDLNSDKMPILYFTEVGVQRL
jgi:hypothetical protein